MSASITSDRANLRKRGTMLAYIFSNQGWGSLFGSLATMIVLACYKQTMHVEGHTSKVDGGKSRSGITIDMRMTLFGQFGALSLESP